MILLLLACARPHPEAPPPHAGPNTPEAAALAAAEAARLVSDSARGGPPLQGHEAPLPPFQGVARDTARYVGAATCAACHPNAATAWAVTDHARAHDTLRAAKAGSNPDCLRCHTTGFRHPGGYESSTASPHLDHLGCESCHGPGSEHAAAPARGYGALPGAASACVACHTYDNSPDFSWAVYWPQIRHGAEGAEGSY